MRKGTPAPEPSLRMHKVGARLHAIPEEDDSAELNAIPAGDVKPVGWRHTAQDEDDWGEAAWGNTAWGQAAWGIHSTLRNEDSDDFGDLAEEVPLQLYNSPYMNVPRR